MKKLLVSALFVVAGITTANAQAGAVEAGTPYSASKQQMKTQTASTSSGTEIGLNIGLAPKEDAFGMNFDLTIGEMGIE